MDGLDPLASGETKLPGQKEVGSENDLVTIRRDEQRPQLVQETVEKGGRNRQLHGQGVENRLDGGTSRRLYDRSCVRIEKHGAVETKTEVVALRQVFENAVEVPADPCQRLPEGADVHSDSQKRLSPPPPEDPDELDEPTAGGEDGGGAQTPQNPPKPADA